MTRRALAPAAAALALLAGAPAVRAEVRPTRGGETGFVEVPSAEVIGKGGSALGADLRLDRVTGEPARFGPFPVYGTAGLLPGLELGFSMRQWGQPGDALPQRTAFGAAAKLQLVQPKDKFPGIAADVYGDRLNLDGVLGGRLIGTLRMPGDALSLGAFVGGEGGPKSGGTWGAALSSVVTERSELVVEALGGPRGESYGGAVRWRATPTAALSLGLNYLPGESGFRVSLGIAFTPRKPIQAEPPPAAPEAAPVAAAPQGPQFTDDRPRFRLRIHTFGAPQTGEPRHVQHGPPELASAAPPRPEPGAKPAAPSLEDLAEAALKEQEALADARERRLREEWDRLDAREKAALAEAARLEARERELAAREQELDARERKIAVKGKPTQEQRRLEAIEAQLAAQERGLLAQERGFVPAMDAAQGRERAAAAREDAERKEATRLAGAAGGAASRALQLELRKQALAARNRQLAALEARIGARGERIGALERQLKAKASRLDAWSRRLDSRADRIDLLERRAIESQRPPPAPKAAAEGTEPPKDKAVFVMVVKSPTAIVQERAAAPAGGAAAPTLHSGVAVDKPVAASTVVAFPTPAAKLSELDAEAIDAVVKLAAREHCELLIWARAKNPGLMGEAQRRAAEIRTLALAAAPLGEKQVVTRITTRPVAQGVDVLVSALRESAKGGAPAAAAAASGPSLLKGESGKRQVREAVQAAKASIEACVGEVITARNLAKAEGSLRLTVSALGRVTKVAAGKGDLGGTQMEDCLDGAAPKWKFPPADAEYVVDVPFTVIRGGAAK